MTVSFKIFKLSKGLTMKGTFLSMKKDIAKTIVVLIHVKRKYKFC